MLHITILRHVTDTACGSNQPNNNNYSIRSTVCVEFLLQLAFSNIFCNI